MAPETCRAILREAIDAGHPDAECLETIIDLTRPNPAHPRIAAEMRREILSIGWASAQDWLDDTAERELGDAADQTHAAT